MSSLLAGLGVVLLVLLTTLVCTFILMFLASWVRHLAMVEDNCRAYTWGSWGDFLREFQSRKWRTMGGFPHSFFPKHIQVEYSADFIHDDIIRFSGVGMKLYPVAFVQFRWWSRSKNLGKWNPMFPWMAEVRGDND